MHSTKTSLVISIGNPYLYEGCGNRVLISLENTFSKGDVGLRKRLQQVGLKHNVDSVLVVTGNPKQRKNQGHHCTMDVFEPRGKDSSGLPGSWSTMCGNGIRTLARFWQDHGFLSTHNSLFVKTPSGVRQVEVLPNHQYRVDMGQLAYDKLSLARYVAPSLLEKQRENGSFNPEDLGLSSRLFLGAFIGLTGTPDGLNRIDGEPHLILFTRKPIAKSQIGLIGLKMTQKQHVFPQEINTNFVHVRSIGNPQIQVQACTFERGIYYMTQACGTGATTIGAFLLPQYPKVQQIMVTMPGGKLIISRKNNQVFMQGPAEPLR